MPGDTIVAAVQPVETHAFPRARPGRVRPGVRLVVTCLAALSALVLLPGCGGGEPVREGEEGVPTTADGGPVSRLLSCDRNGDNCTEVPDECEEDPECLIKQCAESGGCVPTLLGQPLGFGRPGDFRLCFNIEIHQSSEQPVGESTPATTGATETGTNDVASTVECSGPSYPLRGLDVSEDELEVMGDGQLVWSPEDPSLLVTFADGAFTVRDQP